MGKLIEKLREVTQASSGGMGFFARPQGPERAARPAALLVAGDRGDLAALRAAVENGADGAIIAGWVPGTSGIADLAEAIGRREGIWGVELDTEFSAGTLKAAQEQGASFAVFGVSVPASALFEELDRFDLVVTVEPPQDDLALLSVRAVSLLPAQAALIRAGFTPSGLAHLSIADFTRLRLLWESLRFPTLVTLQGAPEASDVRTLVQLGANALVLSATGVTATAVGQQVKALLAELKRTPPRRESEGAPLLGGLLSAAGRAPTTPEPGPTRRPEPEREPGEP
jgi:hypothetical protein